MKPETKLGPPSFTDILDPAPRHPPADRGQVHLHVGPALLRAPHPPNALLAAQDPGRDPEGRGVLRVPGLHHSTQGTPH